GAERAAWRLFFGIEPPGRLARLVGGDGAKRNGAEVIENKQFREMAHFAPPMISRTYARVAKPFISLPRNEPCCFCWVSISSRPKTQWGAKSTPVSGLARRTPRGSAPRKRDDRNRHARKWRPRQRLPSRANARGIGVRPPL